VYPMDGDHSQINMETGTSKEYKQLLT
jgi:hypothetical protein